MKGTVAHQTTDIWGAPWMRAAKPYWGSWIHGGGWIAQHYWEHFRFTQDTVFLRERAYPAIKAYAEFYADWLVLDERDQTLISTSLVAIVPYLILATIWYIIGSFGYYLGRKKMKCISSNKSDETVTLTHDEINA